jgi:hypothetical protein
LQVDIDFDNKAFFVIFTVLGYPPGMDELLNELPDAIRPLPEVYTSSQLKGTVKRDFLPQFFSQMDSSQAP